MAEWSARWSPRLRGAEKWEKGKPRRPYARAHAFAVVQRTLQHGSLTVQVLDWGATLSSVLLPDKRGDVGEVTLGFDELTPYTDGTRRARPALLAF
eukprot:6193222-Pleurochrysis_carterae.AAC.3